MSRALTFLAAMALMGMVAASAGAELTQSGDLFVRFDGGISPHALPRSSPAPISVRIEGQIKVPKGQNPPALRTIRIAINRGGHLRSAGLAVCHRSQIDLATPTEAIARCGPALVGGGGFTAKTSFPDQPVANVSGEILLFNSLDHGRPAILAHAFQSDPIPITRFIVFHLRRSAGTYGTVISGRLPATLNRNGYLRSIYLQLGRNYLFHGHPRSYLSATCSAPPGFTAAVFPFAHAAMSFEGGRSLASTLTRTCKVRG